MAQFALDLNYTLFHFESLVLQCHTGNMWHHTNDCTGNLGQKYHPNISCSSLLLQVRRRPHSYSVCDLKFYTWQHVVMQRTLAHASPRYSARSPVTPSSRISIGLPTWSLFLLHSLCIYLIHLSVYLPICSYLHCPIFYPPPHRNVSDNLVCFPFVLCFVRNPARSPLPCI